MEITIGQLVDYEWNHVCLWGERGDESTWRWDTRSCYLHEELLANALEVLKTSTPYDSLEWEMETEEGQAGYEEECQAREDCLSEVYDIILP